MADGTLLATVVGGAISLVSSAFVGYGLEHMKQRREAKNIAFAFRGGISAILAIIEERRYVATIQHLIALAEAGQELIPLKVRVRRNYIELYTKNVDRIGILDPHISSQIPIFYTYINSLLEDLESSMEGSIDGISKDMQIRFHRDFLDLLLKTDKIGKNIISLIDGRYAATHRGGHISD